VAVSVDVGLGVGVMVRVGVAVGIGVFVLVGTRVVVGDDVTVAMTTAVDAAVTVGSTLVAGAVEDDVGLDDGDGPVAIGEGKPVGPDVPVAVGLAVGTRGDTDGRDKGVPLGDNAGVGLGNVTTFTTPVTLTVTVSI